MSDRLALSATFSVLMMTLYVLFGAEATHVPFGPQSYQAPTEAAVPTGY